MLLSLCEFILGGMLLTTENGGYRMAAFLDEQHMHHLYEKFILEYYRCHFPALGANPDPVNWALPQGQNRQQLPRMQTDITLHGDSAVLVIDAKFYRQTMQHIAAFDSTTLRSAHLYQILTYVKNMAAEPKCANKTVSGMVLYAKTDEAVQPDTECQICGSSIGMKTLDLNQDFSKIAAALDSIADDYFGAAVRAARRAG